MFKIICVTNRHLCCDFGARIQELHKNGVPIILREKDLSEPEYTKLAQNMMSLSPDIILHTHINAANRLHAKKIHLPVRLLTKNISHSFKTVGASVHSVDEAIYAEKSGADYIIAGHIFATDCKKGLPPRGIDFLKSITNSVSIPVYAIGGISSKNISRIKNTGAAGACIMSGFMQCIDIHDYLNALKNEPTPQKA